MRVRAERDDVAVGFALRMKRLAGRDVVGGGGLDLHAGDLARLAVGHHDAVGHLLRPFAAITIGAPGFRTRAIAFGSR